MALSTRRIFKPRWALAFASFTVAAWVLAFTDHLAIAQLLFVLTPVATADWTELGKPIARRTPKAYGVVLAIALVAILLAGAFLGFTHASNEWFLSWPYRAPAVSGFWIIVIASGCGFYYGAGSAREENI